MALNFPRDTGRVARGERKSNRTLSNVFDAACARFKGLTKKEGNYRLRVRRADKVGRYNIVRQTFAVMEQLGRFVSLPFIYVFCTLFLLYLRNLD